MKKIFLKIKNKNYRTFHLYFKLVCTYACVGTSGKINIFNCNLLLFVSKASNITLVWVLFRKKQHFLHIHFYLNANSFFVKKNHLLLHYMATNVANEVSNIDTIEIKKESVNEILNEGNHLPYINVIIIVHNIQFPL